MQIILINILIYKIDNIRKHNVFWPYFICFWGWLCAFGFWLRQKMSWIWKLCKWSIF